MFSKECPAWESCWLARDLHWPGFDWSESPIQDPLLVKLTYKHKPYKDMSTNCRGNKPSNKLKVKQQTSTYGDTKSYCYNDPPPSRVMTTGLLWKHSYKRALSRSVDIMETGIFPDPENANRRRSTFIFGHIRQIFSGQLNKNIVRNSIPVP